MPRPRVLHVVIGLGPGGTERLVVELARRATARVDAAVCCLEDVGEWGEILKDEGFTVTALHRRPGFRPALGMAVAGVASAFRANVLHCHQYSPFVYGCIARVRYGAARLLFTEHGRLADAPPSGKRRTANRLFARLPDRVFTVSDDLRRHLATEGFNPADVDVIYNGVDALAMPTDGERLEMRARLDLPPDAVVVGTVARLDPVKNLETLIEATRLAARTGPLSPVLLVVGDGPERNGLEARAREAGPSDRVRFLGHRDDARRVLAACDIYANSSTFEGISLTILEAMAAGLPIVATAVGGTPEIVDASCGVLTPPRDAARLANALVSLASDRARRMEMGAAGRRAVEARFTLDRMVDDYVRVYEGLN